MDAITKSLTEFQGTLQEVVLAKLFELQEEFPDDPALGIRVMTEISGLLGDIIYRMAEANAAPVGENSFEEIVSLLLKQANTRAMNVIAALNGQESGLQVLRGDSIAEAMKDFN